MVTDGQLLLTNGTRVHRARQPKPARSADNMGLSEACIRRPVMTTLITASLIVFGIFAYRLLRSRRSRRSIFPPSRSRRLCRARAPETMAASVASPIERQMSTISGISSMTSSSVARARRRSPSSSISTAISTALRSTCRPPCDRATPVAGRNDDPAVFRKVNPGDFPVLYISLISQTLPLSTVDEYAEIVLAQQISQLPGVAQVLVYGAQKFAVRVQVDPVAAAAAQYFARRRPQRRRQGQFELAGRHAGRAASRT